MIGLTVTINTGTTPQLLAAMQAKDRTKACQAIGLVLAGQAKRNLAARTGPQGAWPSSPFTGLYGGQRTWRDIGRSIVVEAKQDAVAVGSTHVAAAVRQLGTKGRGGELPDIVPVKKKALTIPLSDAASKASYQGRTAREAFPEAFLLTKDGKHGMSPLALGVIARKVGGKKNRKTGEKEGQTLELLYLLTRRVAIRPHPFLPITADGRLAPESLGREIDELVARAATGEGPA